MQIIFERIFGRQAGSESDTENLLRRLFNNKINQVWGEKEEACLEQVEKQPLTASQRVIVRQIQEW